VGRAGELRRAAESWHRDHGRIRGLPLVQRVLVLPRWCLDYGLSLPGLVSLRRYVGARNRPLAALATGGHRSFPDRGR